MLQLGPGLGLPAAAPGLLGRAVWAGQREVAQSAVTAPGLSVKVVVQPAQGTGVIVTSAANRLIGEVVQSRRRPLLGPSPG